VTVPSSAGMAGAAGEGAGATVLPFLAPMGGVVGGVGRVLPKAQSEENREKKGSNWTLCSKNRSLAIVVGCFHRVLPPPRPFLLLLPFVPSSPVLSHDATRGATDPLPTRASWALREQV